MAEQTKSSRVNGKDSIAVNARFHVHRKAGMQRYAHEVSSRLSEHLREIRPSYALKGPVGHLWEQVCLPASVGSSLLWSPNNTGPVFVRHQVCTIHDIIPIDRPEWFSRSFVSWYKFQPLRSRLNISSRFPNSRARGSSTLLAWRRRR